LLQGALHGDDRTAGNTTTTVQQAMSLFFQDDIRRRCVPGRGRPATDLADLIRRCGTIYLLCQEDPYASASSLMTAVAEYVLDAGGRLGWGRLCPPMLACLDELPSTAPLPTLRTRMANKRTPGISFIYAAQTWRLQAAGFGEQEARALFGLTNVLVMFGGSKGRRLQPGDLRPGRPHLRWPREVRDLLAELTPIARDQRPILELLNSRLSTAEQAFARRFGRRTDGG
jgi:type IV secretion system protein VirD4